LGLILGGYFALLISAQIVDVFRRDRNGADFIATTWQPARDVLDGISPYSDPSQSNFVAESVYPPALFIVTLPLATLPTDAATALWQVGLLLLAGATLAVLGVRDWRCYAIWLASCPVVLDVLYGNATLIIVFCAALVWRYRDVAWVAAIALAAAISIKLLLAPILLWLVVTRRMAAALLAALFTATALAVSWALIGFDGLAQYPSRLDALAHALGEHGVLLFALLRQLGAGYSSALIAVVVVSSLLIAWGIAVRQTELASFTLFISAALVLTPIAWIYYPALLVVPLAVRWPRLSWQWGLVSLMWVSGVYGPFDWATAPVSLAIIAICGVLVCALVRSEPALRALATLTASQPAVAQAATGLGLVSAPQGSRPR
jgi:hypothetical protein